MICILIDNQISRHFYTFIDTYVLAKISWVVKPFEIEREDWVQQNRISQYFLVPLLLIFPQAFRKLKLSQNDTYVRAQWKGNIGNFSSLFIGINQKCIILHSTSLSAWWIIFLSILETILSIQLPQNPTKYQ